MPLQHVANQKSVGTLGGEAVRAGFDDLAGIVAEESGRVHAGHEHAAVDSVPVVHHAPCSQSEFVRCHWHARRHQSHEVRFDLKVDVVGMRVVLRRSGERGGDAALERAPCGEIGMPQTVRSVPQQVAEVLCGCVQALVVQDGREGHFDIEVVLVKGVGHHVGGPLGHLLLGDDALVVNEFGGIPVGNADHLAGPAAFDPISQFAHRDRHLVRVTRAAARP